MTKDELLQRLRKWEYDWTHHLTLEGDTGYDQGGRAIKTFAVKRLRNLIKEGQPSQPKAPFIQPGGVCAAGKHFADEGYPCPECAKETD